VHTPMTSIILPVIVLIAIAAVGTPLIRRMVGAGPLVCTRCDGTGDVNENWPDPSEPTGWHRVSGTCPKCKGKGRVRSR
jgi:hypothetical protein